MSKRGKSLLVAIGMKPKGGEPDGDEGGDEYDSTDDYEPNEGELAAAESLCRALDIPEDRAAEVAKAVCAMIDNHKG
jgi:hypothetical protein